MEVKTKAKIIGLVITTCPACHNPINFDRQANKICAYCETEVYINLDKVEVSLRSPISKKMKLSLN
ncbi:MAG: hypothetical protein Q8N88_00775 [Nanoarchaeota archaeon]|nr:hypothetical protein [Nanoarchaeota archaeon]